MRSRATLNQRLRDTPDTPVPVLIAGGGINGIGLFRDLALQGIPALLVDKGDFASGTSAAPSRLIHGGLRYLETGEFALVTGESLAVRPGLVANCAGAWADQVNGKLGITQRLMGGTRGSHLVMRRPDIARQLGDGMFYFETHDFRACFVYALDESLILLGTTDIRDEAPDTARCSDDEISYLFGVLDEVLPGSKARHEEIVFAYTGIRPLPWSGEGATGAISRDHALRPFEVEQSRPFPVLTLVGGKWTTYRACAEQIADAVLLRLGKPRQKSTLHAVIGGAAGFPDSAAARASLAARIAAAAKTGDATGHTLLRRYGTTAEDVAAAIATGPAGVRPLIGHVKLPDLTRQHVRQVLDVVKKRGAKATVNRTLAALRRALSWALSEDLIAVNPASGIVTQIVEQPKDRALSQDEIRQFWNALDNAPIGERTRLALRLVLATGQRPGEVCGAKVSEIDLAAGAWTIPKERAKNRQAHVVPLSNLAKDLFRQALAIDPDSPFAFTTRARARDGIAKPKAMESHALSHALRDSLKALEMENTPFTPHDLRRTVATHMARLGISDRTVGKVLNHGTELRRTITSRVYIQHDFMTEKKAALDAWAIELEQITRNNSIAGNVVTLRAK
jgi:glycerol-3-phosphate dehydrogenase